MRLSTILFLLLVSVANYLVAQEQDPITLKVNVITNLGVKDTTNLEDGLFKIQSDQNIDMVIFSDKQGKIVLKEIPQNNQIAISALKPGFYLLCAYCKGVKIKKGILKKTS